MLKYEDLFNGYDVPKHIKDASIAICKRFCLFGLCDGMYVANVMANQNGMGDGAGGFNGKNHVVDRKTAEFLQHAYSSCIIPDEIDELTDLLNGRINMYAFRKGLERTIKRYRDEKRRIVRSGNVYDSWRVEYLNKCIKHAKDTLATC